MCHGDPANCFKKSVVGRDAAHIAANGLDNHGGDLVFVRAKDFFDGAYSNFGPLNCVPSLPDAARLIADRLRPRGMLVVSVIGRVCPWEIARYLIRGDWPRAGIRFSRNLVAVPLEGRTVWMRYHTPGTFEPAFKAAGFARVSVIDAKGATDSVWVRVE